MMREEEEEAGWQVVSARLPGFFFQPFTPRSFHRPVTTSTVGYVANDRDDLHTSTLKP